MNDLKPLFGNDIAIKKPIIMAGPCSAESEEQVMETARGLKDAGVRIYRAGVWKPRTKPGCFEGIGKPALQWLKRVNDELGMHVATEVATPTHLAEALDSGIDIIWIGARTSASPFAVQELANALGQLPEERKERLTVLVKNPVNPDLELWIGALERVYLTGIRKLGAIHRGFTIYGKHMYRNPPEWRVPIELHRRLPQLPIFIDPSHIGGKRELIGPLSQQALQMNFNGLIIESHCNPEKALSDAEQQVTPSQLKEILEKLTVTTEKGSEESLNGLRSEIDRIDSEIIDLLAQRMDVARQIGVYKLEHAMSVVQSERYNELMRGRVEEGMRLDISEEFMRRFLSAIHEESVRQQLEIRIQSSESNM